MVAIKSPKPIPSLKDALLELRAAAHLGAAHIELARTQLQRVLDNEIVGPLLGQGLHQPDPVLKALLFLRAGVCDRATKFVVQGYFDPEAEKNRGYPDTPGSDPRMTELDALIARLAKINGEIEQCESRQRMLRPLRRD